MGILQVDLDNLDTYNLLSMQLAVECILAAAEIGTASGIVYLSMSRHGMSLSVYTLLLDTLMQLGRIEVVSDFIRIPQAVAA